MQTLISEATIGFMLGVPFAVGVTLLMLVLPYRIFRDRAKLAGGVALASVPVLSVAAAFLAVAWLSALVTLPFAMMADCIEGQCIPYISEESRGVVANQLFLRLIAPPPLQHSCFAGEYEACAVAKAIAAHPSFRDGFPLPGWGGFLRASVLRTYGALLTGIALPVFISRRRTRESAAA